MSLDLEHIKNLIFEELAGTLEADEKAYLDRMANEYPEVNALRQDIKRFVNSEPIAKARENLPYEIPLENILNNVKRRKRGVYRRVSVGIAAAVVVVAAGIYMLNQPRKTDPLAVNKHSIQLSANGRTIDLSATQSSVRLGKTTLHNTNKTLTYTASAAGNEEPATLTVPVGKDYTIHLSDGTAIQLNAGTSLQFPFTFNGPTREITINGEAFLKVAPNPGKPFIVHLPHSSVQVLGTEFNVNTYDSGHVKVALVNGSVKMATSRDSLVLKPGQQLSFSKKGLEVQPFDEREVLSWRQGIYMFRDTKLQDAASIVNRWYGVELVLDNPAAGNLRYYGIIDRNQPVTAFLDNLKESSGIQYHIEGDRVHIR